ncbi:aminotransferase class V-fold PLP-dependent enzyme [Pseudonocardia sp. C8]|uniref:aminotransferase class V-fold PLP-dependent enzyme n=1 Tax=Pseudonocardia sp. C8 TaxID=2762759 RepID=UPI001642DB02|nr:aminotransferase class V-fold PLP-dependent enzyme [Pseudonocardia sp. C8]MBC3189595.1 aminotransferase class V-fold PLP-dependent enzyme [Pseudonocardia sp. C8]
MEHPTPAEFRRRFPAFADTVHLASCSQGALSDELSSALAEFQHTIRAHGAPWDLWMGTVERARTMFAELIGATPDEVAVVPSASAGAYQVASTQDWGARPGLVTTDLEFPSVAHVWLAQRERGARIAFADEHDGQVRAEDYAAAIGDDTGLVSVPLVSYRNGYRFEVADVVAAAHARGAKVLVDAYQGLGVEPVSVRELDCDYLVCGALKYLLGIPGIAFLYVRGGLADAVDPPATGWFGRRDPFEFDPRNLDYPAGARRFEAGTPSVPSAYGAVAGLRLLAGLDAKAVRAHVTDLTSYLVDELRAAGETVGSPSDAERRGPQVAVRDADPEALSAYLKSRRIVCSPRGDVLRISFHYYNDASDVDAVLRALADHRRTR